MLRIFFDAVSHKLNHRKKWHRPCMPAPGPTTDVDRGWKVPRSAKNVAKHLYIFFTLKVGFFTRF